MYLRNRPIHVLDLIVIFLVGFAIQTTLIYIYSKQGAVETLFTISSDSLMQTLPAVVLREYPFSSIYFNHIQPPLFDAIRTLIATFWNSGDGSLVAFVDLGIFWVYRILFGIFSILVFVWIFKATCSRYAAWTGALIWIFHPGPISMAFFLDGTFLSSLLTTWLIFEIWLLRTENNSVFRLTVAAILCFLVRAHFQWFFVPVIGICLVFMGVDRRRLLISLATLSLIVGIYCMKQFVLFGTFYSYGFHGLNLTGSVWIEDIGYTNKSYETVCGLSSEYRNKIDCKKFLSKKYPVDLLQLDSTYPKSANKLSSGRDHYNKEYTWWLSHVHSRIAKLQCSTEPVYCIKSLWRSFRQNFPEYWVESWDSRNPIVSNQTGIPWTSAYNKIVHNYPWFILASIVVVTLTTFNRFGASSIMPLIGIGLVPLYVYAITLTGNIYDAFEGGRLKFLLEPSIFVFIFTQCYLALRYIYVGSQHDTRPLDPGS